MRTCAAALIGHRARRRWIHLVLGGALAMPYVLVGAVVVGPLTGTTDIFSSLPLQLSSLAVGLPLAALTALFPLTRPLSVAAVRALCGVDGVRDRGALEPGAPEPAAPDLGVLADGPARSAAARVRTSAWFVLHLGTGAVISGMTLATPPFAVALMVLPLVPAWHDDARFRPGLLPAGDLGLVLAPVVGAALLVALAGCAALAAGLLARGAPMLLGPAPADRLAAAERRAADLAVRNRLARELHDSVGHALSAVTLQAGAARRVLDSDPEFVREALAAIEDTTRRTVGELDTVLGVLRDGDPGTPTAPAPTLAADLDGLLRRTRAGGLRVDAAVDPGPHGLDALPPPVSREAYRIVQEALGNALRYAGTGATVTLRVAVADGSLEIMAANPLPPADAPPVRLGGGHGLRGVTDRARLLGGTASAGPGADGWLLRVRLPLAGPDPLEEPV
ncbi:sensor histidine kinase [Streptomyces sp. NPDC091292]|uniref:sensor histidine kinase n=1 Tax=Streptomyces sp. NPDC091292 TaxID=3365991 RepID=UPI0037FBD89E